MVRLIVLALLGSSVAVGVKAGKLKSSFRLKTESCNLVELKLSAKTGNCFIRPSKNEDNPLNIYSNQDFNEYAHSFSNEFERLTCKVNLSLEQDAEHGVSQKISYRVFGSN